MVDLTAAARRIAAERKARGWTQMELGRRTGINPGFINQIESGKRGVSLTTLVALAGIFGLTLNEILTAPEEAERVA